MAFGRPRPHLRRCVPD